LDPHLVGTLCGLASAAIYTASNSFLRAVNDCDVVWVSAVKAMPTVVFMAPWLWLMMRRGEPLFRSWYVVGMVAAAGLGGQLIGNVSFQFALSELGVALTVPLTLGGMIVSASILSRVFLHEPITWMAAIALCVLLLAIMVLSLGAQEAGESVSRGSAKSSQVLLAVGAGGLCGLAYSVLNVVIRYGVVRGMPLATTLFIVSTTGIVSLGAVSWWRLGLDNILATTGDDLLIMVLAGVCNTVAFLALTRSLQLTSVVYVNALNATQAALAALAGVLLFQEALSSWLLVGVLLTVVGLVILTRSRSVPVVPREV
jgi:DME family drug/metabolite transporter